MNIEYMKKLPKIEKIRTKLLENHAEGAGN